MPRSKTITKPHSLASEVADVRRRKNEALASMRSPELGSTLGQLFATHQISEQQHAAGKRWAEIVSEYSRACRSPLSPRSISLGETRGPHRDSETGNREITRHRRATETWIAARDALRRAGFEATRTVVAVVEHDQVPTTTAELEALRTGLNVLWQSWSTARKPRG